jgi:hypothetical protein
MKVTTSFGKMGLLRIGLVAVAALVALIVVSAGMGLTGAWDKYFTVRLVNQTHQTVLVDNHGDTVQLRPGQIDAEWGSSTANQPILVRLGRSKVCVNLFFRRAPRHPLSIRLVGQHLSVPAATGC